jgi:hypothetical protein
VGWEDAGFEPGTAGQQTGTLPLSHHALSAASKLGPSSESFELRDAQANDKVGCDLKEINLVPQDQEGMVGISGNIP